MVSFAPEFSTGLPGLDRVLKGLKPGDNVVWQVTDIDDYRAFVQPYAEFAVGNHKHLVYFRFASHPPLLAADCGAEIHQIDPREGFEKFISRVHNAIQRAGRGAFYVFDCLSELADVWYSDQMVANAFVLTCPYLYDLETITYFGLLRNYHSVYATKPIQETTQLFLDVHRHHDRRYLHPRKVQQRYSPTMFMLHAWSSDDDFAPVTDSITIAEIMISDAEPSTSSARYQLGVWNRTFLQAEEVLHSIGRCDCRNDKEREFLQGLLKMAISRDDRVLALAEKYLTIEDVLRVRRRIVGTGRIGGKSVGMLLARAILKQHDERWRDLLEVHDSYFIGSDVFYTFLVQNGCWWAREKQRHPQTFLEDAGKARQRILTGAFPENIMRQFEDMLDYFGQSPIIVRSSSLLEDNFGNSFVGKYDSVFCPNQGHRKERLEDFLSAVRTIYASTMSEKALQYRAQRGILDLDEQMALLVQRVSGRIYGDLYYPQIAGVGLSLNPYVWSKEIDPQAGMLRLVFGLGTRAVDRSDTDYTRVVALNAPDKRPEASFDDVRRFAQHKVDVLDLQENQWVCTDFPDVARRSPDLPLELFASRDYKLERMARERGVRDMFPWVLTFHKLLKETDFIADMQEMLRVLHTAYDYPVDVEFTANFFGENGGYKINVVQCRPLQVKGGGAIPDPPACQEEDLVLESHGAVVGQSREVSIDRVIYVVPSGYANLSGSERGSVARLIGRLAHLEEPAKPETIMLLGPGRWGTTMPSLGVPVTFPEINTVSVLCEIVAMRDDLVPDVSLGTHFFSELVEMDVLYMAVFPTKSDTRMKREFFETTPNKLIELLPDAERWSNVVRVIDPADLGQGRFRLCANTLKQVAVCYFDRNGQ